MSYGSANRLARTLAVAIDFASSTGAAALRQLRRLPRLFRLFPRTRGS